MSAPVRWSAFDRFISPPALFIGMTLGFAVAPQVRKLARHLGYLWEAP
jgi:hypothetical protein